MRNQTVQLGRASWFVCIVLAVGAAAAGENAPDALKQYLSRFARGYSDCGIVSVDGTARLAVQECVMESVATKQAFIARFDHHGDESVVSDALVMSPSGVLTIVLFDPWGCKKVECLDIEPCGSPKLAIVGERLRITCVNTHEM